jgi:hypothetical protein
VLAGLREDGARLLEGELLGFGVGRVLARALLAAAAEVDDRRPTGEPARDLGREAFQLVLVDRERKLTDEVVGAPANCR